MGGQNPVLHWTKLRFYKAEFYFLDKHPKGLMMAGWTDYSIFNPQTLCQVSVLAVHVTGV